MSKKKEKGYLELLREGLERELFENQQAESLYAQAIVEARHNDNLEAIGKLTAMKAAHSARIIEIQSRLKDAGVIEKGEAERRKLHSDMLVNRWSGVIAGGNLALGGLGLYLGYKGDKEGLLTNRNPLGFFSNIFNMFARKNC